MRVIFCNNQRVKKLFCCFSVIIFAFFFLPSSAYSEEIVKFDTQITAHKDGTMDVTEKINYDFGNVGKHGIFRKIPLVSRVGNLYRVIEIDVKSVLRDGEPEEYKDNSSVSDFSLKIGRSNTLVTGRHFYTISYLVKNGIGSNYADHDEIYWNITGNEWTVPILSATSELTTDFGALPNRAACYTGAYGSAKRMCVIENSSARTTGKLETGEGLSLVWNFPKNTFPPSTLLKESPSMVSSSKIVFVLFFIVGIYIALNLVLAPGLFIWYWKKKRKKSMGQPSVNFDIPQDSRGRVLPAEAGSIDTHNVDEDDIVATIFDLAIRKYIKIIEVKKEKILNIFGKEEDYEISKIKSSDNDLKEFEKILLRRLFMGGETIAMSSLNKDFYETFEEMEQEIFKSHMERGFYVKNPKAQIVTLLVLGIIAAVMGSLILGPVLIFLSRVLNGRTRHGDEMDFRIDGLKLFLKNMKRNYEWQAKKIYVVEQMIPYAIAFGMIDNFMTQLKEIYPDYKPTWYQGNTSFYVASGALFESANRSFITSAPSSSSGFSGGGFSGGGGGGGGGGSWWGGEARG